MKGLKFKGFMCSSSLPKFREFINKREKSLSSLVEEYSSDTIDKIEESITKEEYEKVKDEMILIAEQE